MKKIVFLCLGLLCFSLSAKVVDIQHWQTKNGVKVYFVHAKQIPMLDISVIFKAGSVYDQGHYGLAMLTNAMLNEGALHYSADQLANNFDNIGAVYNNIIGKETSVLSLRTLVKPNTLKKALANFSLILRKPTFPEKNLERIKQQVLVGLKGAEQQPTYLARQAFAKAVWGKHPYSHPVGGTEKTVSKLTRADIKTFYNHYYVANNASVVLVGDVSRVQAQVIADQVVGELPTGIAAPPLAAVKTNAPSHLHVKFPASQNTIMIGETSVKRSSPDYFPLAVGNYILGGGGNLTSILMSNVREKYGLTYGVSSNFLMLTQGGAFFIQLQSRNDQASRATNMSENYLAQYLAKGPTSEQLKMAKDYLLGSFPLRLSNNASIMGAVVNMVTYNLPLNYLDTYERNIKAVSANEVKIAFNKALNMKRLVVVSVGGEADGKQQ